MGSRRNTLDHFELELLIIVYLKVYNIRYLVGLATMVSSNTSRILYNFMCAFMVLLVFCENKRLQIFTNAKSFSRDDLIV